MARLLLSPSIRRCRHSLLTALFALAHQGRPADLVPPELFKVPDGLEVTVWATTPMLHNPTNMDVDCAGRIWVAQARNYRMFRNTDVFPQDAGGDAIVVLTDTDGDGKADHSKVFVQGPELVSPLGIAVIDNRVVVSQPPALIVYEDVNRDAVFDPAIDRKEYLLTGFGGKDHDHSLHAVKTGPDGRWYFNVGNAGTHIVTDRSGWTLRLGSSYSGGAPSVTDPGPNQGGRPGLASDDGHVYVGSAALTMNADGTGLRVIGHNMRNSYEECVTSFGDVFQNDNDDPPACRTTWLMEYGNMGFASDDGQRKWQAERRPGQPAAIAEWRQEDPGTLPAGDVYGTGSPTGIAFCENSALGDSWNGLLLSCEALRNEIYGYFPKPAGAGFMLERFSFLRIKTAAELGPDGAAMASQGNYFRPSDIMVGTDGALYVADWYDARIGGHRMSDQQASGTIYRIAPKGRSLKAPAYDLNTQAGQIAALCSPANNVRNAGFTRLKAAGPAAIPAVQAVLQDANPHIRARAVFLLAQLGPQGIDIAEDLLRRADAAEMRIAAFRALRTIGHRVLALAAHLADDPSPAVRREAALALRDLPLADAGPILLTIARQFDGVDRWYLEAIGAACAGKEEAVYQLLSRELGNADPLQWDSRFAGLAWRLHPAASIPAFRARALAAGLAATERKAALTAIAFNPSEAAALAMIEIAGSGDGEVRKLAAFWLTNRSQGPWAPFSDRMKGLNVQQDGLPADRDYRAAIDAPEITRLPPVEEVLKLTGDPARGRITVARCLMCHQIGGSGVDFGPALSGWGRGNSREVIATAIMHPGRDIAHGFDATEITTKKGHVIQGLIMATGGSTVIKVTGGGEVTVPRGEIRAENPMQRSLMLSAGQLGLTAQDVADVVDYLRVQPVPGSGEPPPSVPGQAAPAGGR